MTQATLLEIGIRGLRMYTLYSPLEKGRWRVAELMYACARRTSTDHKMSIRSRDGRRFRIAPCEPQYHMGLLDRGTFEPEVTAAAQACIEPGAVVVDAGANFGWYTTLFSRLAGPQGAVHAFEPFLQTVHILQENCRLNDCRNVTVNARGLGEQEGTAVIYYDPSTACGDASMFPAAGQKGVAHQCQLTTLDAYFAEKGLRRCDFIKCDVEGAELAFLKGAADVIETHKPIVLIEINPATLSRADCTGRDVLERLSRHGDYLFEIVGEPGTHAQRRGRIVPEDCEKLHSYVNVLCYPSARAPFEHVDQM